MCHLCQTNAISRRDFIRWGTAALAATWLAGCTSAEVEPAAVGSTHWHGRPTPADYPTLAGTIAQHTAAELVLTAPVGQRTIRLTANTRWQTASGTSQKEPSAEVGTAVLVWLDPASEAAQQVQAIPNITTVSAEQIPTDVPQPPPTGAAEPFGPLSFITRAGWGSAEPAWAMGGEAGLYDAQHNPGGWLEYPAPLSNQLHTAVVHHSALNFDQGPREIQAIHMRTALFADVGYHLLIDGLGQLYEGRPLNVRGAHTGGHNTGYVGICLLGNFEQVPPLRAQLETLTTLLGYLQSQYTIGRLGSHREFQPGVTACPGQYLQPELGGLRNRLGLGF